MKTIDLRSDTVTHPTQEMRKAMFEAEVGDDVLRDDPTVNELERIAAEILGKEASLFVPSGTMGNQLALMTSTRRGDEVIVSDNCHIFHHEVGGAAVLSGANLRMLSFPDGIYDVKQNEAAIRPVEIHEPPTTLICMENALANGRVVPLETMKEIYELAHSRGILVHTDGARIFNAAVALGVDVKELTQFTDSISCCLSKGLCAPVGSVLAGTKEFVERARKYRKMLGGGMRQVGILAAAGILAITEMPKRLSEDHENARYLAGKLNEIPGVHVDPESVQINMVFCDFDWENLSDLQDWMRERNILIGGYEGKEVRMVTHNGVGKEDIDTFIGTLKEFPAKIAG